MVVYGVPAHGEGIEATAMMKGRASEKEENAGMLAGEKKRVRRGENGE